MAKAQLWNVAEGKLVDYELSVDRNGEYVATYGDSFLKFPFMNKKQLQSAFAQFNKTHEGLQALDPKEVEQREKDLKKAQDIIDSL